MSDSKILVRGPVPLPCSFQELKHAVFVEAEGIGDVTSANVSRKGWSLEIEFDTPNCFAGLIDGVRIALTRLDLDLFSVNVRIRRTTYRLVDLF